MERIAELEDRSPAQVAAAALRFYVRLPAEARAALRRVEKLGTGRDLDALTHAITRKALDADWEVAHRQFLAEMTVDAIPASEDGILEEAVRLTR